MFSTGRLRHGLPALIALLCVTAAHAQTGSSDATLFRVFLRDGTTLVSYGEFARVADRLVLSMPIGGTTAAPTLQLVSIPASGVDWDKTDAYAEAARAARYAVTRGADDYALLELATSNALAEISRAADPDRKVAMAVEARQNVTKWVAEHYGYRSEDAAHLASMFDDVIADVRRAAGQPNFNLSLIANTAVPPSMPLMAAPTPRESLEEGVRAAELVGDPAERTSLLRAIRDSLAAEPPSDWVTALRARVTDSIVAEERTDRLYASLTRRTLYSANLYARNAQVTRLTRLSTNVLRQDDLLGHRRPQEMASLLAALDAKLDAARRLRLARDQWALHQALVADYRRAIATPMEAIRFSRAPLIQIRDLAGPSQGALTRLGPRLSRALEQVSAAQPPSELQSVHTLLVSALRLAQRAAAARQDAVMSGQMQGAWDAASAASGALMLFDRATDDLKQLATVSRPQ